jgi:hypothetical protein
MEFPMPNATVGANAQALPEPNTDPDAELISDVAELHRHAKVLMGINEPKKGLYDEALSVESYEDLLSYLSDELWWLREKISGTRASTNMGAKAKLSAAMIEFELDEHPYLFLGPGSFDDLLRSIHLDMLALDAENTAALAARRSALLEPVDA